VSQSERAEPINITGRETIYDSKADTFTVRGKAVMTQGGSVLHADEIELFRKQREAVATGNVHLIDPQVEVWAKKAKVNVANETLDLYDATVRSKRNTYHLKGDRIQKLQGQNYRIVKGFFTTCGCTKGAPDWSISANEMDVNVGHKGHATGASFDILGQPIIKIPYATFPADTDRQSGLLAGRQGQSGLRGFQYLQPYYIAINKSQDATVALDVETSQRIGGLAEYRLTNGVDDYLWADGAFYDESIRSNSNRQSDIVDNQIADPHIPVDRYGIIGMTREHLTDNLMAYGNAVSVSDSLYLREMDVWTLSRGFGGNWGSLRNAQSNFGLLDEFENGYAQMQGTWNQDLIQPQNYALQELPQLALSGRQNLGSLAFADYDAQATYFYRADGVQGWRFLADPHVTLPWRLGDYLWGYGSAGVLSTVYDTSGHNVNVIPVGTHGLSYNNGLKLGALSQGGMQANGIPYLTTGAGTELERVWNIGGDTIEKLKNTIDPFVSYAYVPRIYQGDQPLFDQYDRYNSRSLVTYGFTTRLFAKMAPHPEAETEQSQDANAPGSGVGPFGQQSQLNDSLAPTGASSYSNGANVNELAQVTVMQAYDFSHDLSAAAGRISDLEGLVTLYPTNIASLGSQVDYNPRGHLGITFANVFFNFQPPWSQVSNMYMGRALEGSFLQTSYNYVNRENAVLPGTLRNASEFVSVRAYSDVFDRLGVYFAPSYDVAAGRLLSSEYGVRLKSPCNCWAADFGLISSYNPNEVQFQFQLTLGGLGSFGQSPFGRNPFQEMGLAGSPTGVLAR
jgi:lipopolysaccharide assembly outer membrane protein LptD (OstA)